jgi:hypothetical protein
MPPGGAVHETGQGDYAIARGHTDLIRADTRVPPQLINHVPLELHVAFHHMPLLRQLNRW